MKKIFLTIFLIFLVNRIGFPQVLSDIFNSQPTQFSSDKTKSSNLGIDPNQMTSNRQQFGNLPLVKNLGPTQNIQNQKELRTDFENNQSQNERGVKKYQLSLNNFQKLILNEKGIKLSNYGFNLFNDANYKYPQNIPVPADYILGTGDEIDIKIWGSINYENTLTINKEGLIYIPEIGSFQISGTKASKLDEVVRNKIKGSYKQFSSSTSISKLRSIKVYFVGESINPGAFTVSGLSSLIAAVYESGGPTQLGDIRNIQLIRGGKLISSLDLYEFMTKGDSSSDIRLIDGDVILIPESKNNIALLGELDKPGIYELKDSEKFEELLKIIGIGSPTTSYEKIMVESINKSNFDRPRSIREFKDLSELKSYLPKDGDVISFYPIKKEFSNSIIIRGNISVPRKHEYIPGMRVSDVIPNQNELVSSKYYELKNSLIKNKKKTIEDTKGNVELIKDTEFKKQDIDNETEPETETLTPFNFENKLPNINWDYASIDRLEKDKFNTKLISFNLYKAIHKDPSNDLELEPGDVITIYNSKDFKLPVSVKVPRVLIQGEISQPGYYEVMKNETITDLIKRVGGLTEKAYIYGSIFSRESVRANQEKNFEQYVNRFQNTIESTKNNLIQNSDTLDKQRIAQGQIAVAQTQLDRLKSIKPTGRLSLEINPNDPKFPPISLEDGDKILIPTIPSTVEVLGSVFSETTFIYKEKKTVNDYLNLAGPTKEADFEQIFVIRADGSATSSYHKYFYESNIKNAVVYPGDTIIVPELIDRQTTYTKFIQGAKDWTAILYQFGLGAAGLKILRN